MRSVSATGFGTAARPSDLRGADVATCAPQLAEQLREPADPLRLPLLRSYRPQDWLAWFKLAGLTR